jgi:hypothetical protein
MAQMQHLPSGQGPQQSVYKEGWPADFPYAVAVLCGEEGYLTEGEDFKPNQSAATEAKTGCIRMHWGLNNL